jgi:Zn-dependent oligopeptidase
MNETCLFDQLSPLVAEWENFGRRLTDWTTMTKISGHFESGQPLDRETFNQLNKAAVHMVGTDLCQQLYLSALDIELHST